MKSEKKTQSGAAEDFGQIYITKHWWHYIHKIDKQNKTLNNQEIYRSETSFLEIKENSNWVASSVIFFHKTLNNVDKEICLVLTHTTPH